MKNQEMSIKLQALVSKTPSKWIVESNKRFEDKEGLRYSQQVAVRVLRTLREKKLSQKDLADLLKVTPQTVNKWVKGSENFGFFTIGRIEKALNIKLMHIYENNNSIVISSSNVITISNQIHTYLNKIEETMVGDKETKVIPLNTYINEEECMELKYNHS
ncbi:helix-turn-helix domain-containing protein [Flavobacterium limnophilum]|uniref:helix-turn-helix domain-containing protein n=1 Tax=Flavobacterium limnophilum TaxID=3003262 RepID=UPI00248212F9|nr:helix-turn-helix transcriptional regulator [Flavobacterium limnophilum]